MSPRVGQPLPRGPESILRAISASRLVVDLTRDGPRDGRVLSTHSNACNILLTGDNPQEGAAAPILTLGGRKLGNGPLNVLLDEFTPVRRAALPRAAVRLGRDRLSIGRVTIVIRGTTLWNPRPTWAQLRRRPSPTERRIQSVLAIARRGAPPQSLLDLLPPRRPADGCGSTGRRLFAEFVSTLDRLEADGTAGLPAASAALAGLGTGLTPAGDDFLMGLMLALWLRSKRAPELCRLMSTTAAKRTGRLSASLLKQAAAGNCGAHWHAFLKAFTEADKARVDILVTAILDPGHTSGGDALAGFLWACRYLEFPARSNDYSSASTAAPASAHSSSCSAVPPPAPIAPRTLSPTTTGTAP